MRHAFDSFRLTHVSKPAMVAEKEPGIVTSWDSTLRIGNPGDIVVHYMAFTTAGQQ